ncbi:MAG: response regulator [Magnetococcales bacterium]|nr:response regulator [Magnetococcales bacterium]
MKWFARIWREMRLDVKVIGSTLTLLGIMTLVLGWSAIAAEQRALSRQIQSQGASLAEAAAIFSIEPLLTLDHGVLNSYVHRLTRTQSDIGFVRILDASGRVVAQSPEQADQAMPESASVRLFRVPVLVEPEDTEPVGAVELGLLTRQADLATATRVHWLTFGSLAIFVVLALALSMLLKKTVTDPVRRLDRHVRALGHGDLESVILLPGADELGRLSMAMDAMRRDIRASHDALRRQEEYVASLVACALDMIVAVDRERRIVIFNPAAAKCYGYAVEEVQGREAGLLYARHEEAQAVFATIQETGKFVGEITGQRKDGSCFPVFLSASLLKDRLGRVIGSLGSSRDISEQKQVAELERARRAAEAANQAKSAFLAVMSHEIRSPMNGVIGMADLLAATELSGEQRQYVEIILRSSHSLLGLLNGILDFSKAEAGALRLEQVAFHPREVVAMACEIMAVAAHGKGLRLIHEVDGKVPECLRGDPLRLRQVLVNLVNNAVKFTPVGEIRVTVAVATTEWHADGPVLLHCTVRDTGIGVPMDKQELIFERFSQADFSTTRKFGGAGLGLAISRQLVELMQGRMWLESRGEGQGSAFHFLARFHECHDADLVVPDERPAMPVVRSRALRILVVDDGVDNRILASHILRKEGHRVEHAENGKVALARLAREPFDLVLMDVQMPEMDGIAATRMIRDGGAGSGVTAIPILGISAGALREERANGLAAGMDEFLTKPYRARALLDAVQRVTRLVRRAPVRRFPEAAAGERRRLAMERLATALESRDRHSVTSAAKELRERMASPPERTLAVRIALAAQKDHLERAREYFDRLQTHLRELTET